MTMIRAHRLPMMPNGETVRYGEMSSTLEREREGEKERLRVRVGKWEELSPQD